MIAYSDPLPLRSTVVWGGFAAAQPIPHRYGQTAGALIPYDAGRRTFVWADHACATVAAVTVDGQPAQGWQWSVAQDSTGQAVTFVTFTQSVDAGATLTASGTGKLHAITGQAIDNPADVVVDVLAALAGMNVAAGDLADFRAACNRLGLRVAGSIEARDSAQRVVAGICASVGAVFSPDAPGLCHLWPPEAGSEGTAVATVDQRSGITCSASLDDVATVLAINFDFADGSARQAVEVAAPDAIVDYGRRELALDAPWLADPLVALAVATRLLQAAARPQWRIDADAVPAAVRCGQWVSVTHALAPVTGTALALATAYDLQASRTAVSVRMPAGAVPRTVLVRQSAQTAQPAYSSATVDTVGDQRVLTVTDSTGRPLAAARAVLDGTYTRFTDAGGRVTFPASIMPRGSHSIEVTGDGTTLVFTVVVP